MRSTPLLPLLMLSAITALSTNCSRSYDQKSIFACMAAQHTPDDYKLVTKCEPLARPEKFDGTWFVGFELSNFAANYKAVPAKLGNPSGLFDLTVQSQLNTTIHKKDAQGLSAYQITFIGRRSLLHDSGQERIVADHLISIREVPLASNQSTIRPSRPS